MKSVIRKTLHHDVYLKCLKKQTSVMSEMNLIRSYKHKFFTIRQKKVGLRCFDSKRYILDGGINTLAFNHVLLKPIKRL